VKRTRKCGMTKLRQSAALANKLLVNTPVTIKPEQGWSERTPLSATYAVKALSSMILGKQTTSILVTLIAH
jgi:LPS O-antigen subunit length determinant protein (WzzB/FepE family)